ncbi:MAG: hypothetical protein ACQGVC_24400 [Myxococcota bacterium]
MSALLGAGVAVMILADAVVGSRLVMLARRTRQLPELGLGGSLLLLGAIGYPLSIAARSGVGGSPEADAAWLAAGLGLQNLGCAAMALATVATFHSGSAVARGVAVLLTAMLAGSWTAQLATGDFGRPTGTSVAYWVGFAGRVLPFVWSAAESWRYHGLLRRRLRIGLADAAVTDRFRLWAVSATGVVCAFGVFMTGLLTGTPVSTSPWVLAPTSLFGVVSGVTLWLAFLPPKAYLARLESPRGT